MLVAASAASAQEKPLPPPGTPPESRLTVTPSEFERWLGRAPAGEATTGDTAAPRLVAPPPPPPVLIAPPPPALPLPAAPSTGTPPSSPKIEPPAKPPAATFPTESGATNPATTMAPGADSPPPEPVRIRYDVEATALPASVRPALDTVAGWLRDNPDVRIELLGYASESSRVGSQARRRSLKRVLAVRDYLVGKGVLSTRMNVRALGDQATDGPQDRVDVRILQPGTGSAKKN